LKSSGPKGPKGDIEQLHLAGGLKLDEPFGVVIVSNITPDRETGIGAWTDEEIIRAIREGKGRDGKTLGPPMPYNGYRELSDNDVKAIVAYLRTLKPIKNKVARTKYKIPLPPAYGPPVGDVPEPDRADPLKYGEYLATVVAHCSECHTPFLPGPGGRKDMSKQFAGGFEFRGPWGRSYSANLTPDKETGIGSFGDGQVTAAVLGAALRRKGRLSPPHPWPYYVKGTKQEDLRAIIRYLRTLKPVRNRVPSPKPPGS
jgi:mono/diheme cytochrome c family protein